MAVRDTSSADILSLFDDACTAIESARQSGRAVLVHCHMGMSRSVSIVLAYFVRHRNTSLQDAFEIVSAMRPVACPNEGFWCQLAEWEMKYRDEISIDHRRFQRFQGTPEAFEPLQ